MLEMLLSLGKVVIDPVVEMVSSVDFATGTEISTLGGVTSGTLVNNDAGWFKFTYRSGKIIYMAAKPIRHNLIFNNLSSANVVTGAKQVTVKGELFKLRVPSASLVNPVTQWSANDFTGVANSEWDKCFKRVAADLGLTNDEMNGGYSSWCQEYRSSDGRRVSMGSGADINRGYVQPPTFLPTSFGWRPVLEKV